MPSRLSSLLVRDGLIGVKRMERAFQRQVIYGGTLDTILLEMSLIDEPSLSDYLSLATGLPPATSNQQEVISSEATELCDLETSRAFHVAPLTYDGDALRVLVCEPVDFAQLEDLADRLDVAIQPLIVPEFRFHIMLDRAFDRSGDARYHRLAEIVSEIEPTTRRRMPTAEDLLEAPAQHDSNSDAGDPTADSAADDTDDTDDTDDFEKTPTTFPDTDPNIVAPLDADGATPDNNTTVPAIGADANVADVLEARSDSDDSNDGGSSVSEHSNDSGRDYGGDEEQVVDDSPDREIVDMPLPPVKGGVRSTQKMSSDAVAARLAQSPEPRRISDAYRIVRPARSLATQVTAAVGAPSIVVLNAEPAEPEDVRFSAAHDVVNSHGVLSGEIAEEPQADHRRTTTGERLVGLSALSVAEAEELLETADDRDLIFSIVLRGLSSVAEYAALLAVQGGAAMGRMALDDGAVDVTTVASVLIPLGLPSAFQQVVQTGSPYIGKVASGVAEVDEQVTILGGVMPPSALLLPIALRNRVVAIAVGHSRNEHTQVSEVSDSFRLAQAAADALSRLIRSSKTRSGPVASTDAKNDSSETNKSGRESGREVETTNATAGASAVLRGVVERTKPKVPTGPVRDPEIEELLDTIQTDDRAAALEAKRALVGRAAEAVPFLDDRFPGTLTVDRYEVGWRTIRAGQYGPMMDLVVTLGAPCGPMLAEKLGDPRRDVRYYAAVCAAELRPEAALEALVQRLFDRDYGVRDIAIHALGGYPARELNGALSQARHALNSDDSERVMAAANALAVLGDLPSIPALLDLVAGDRDVVEPAKRALRRLTAQDFGNSYKKWRQWWNKNSDRSRIEWLLDSLAHRDDELRRRAVDDLRKLTGESFGFRPDASKREREAARKRWSDWWSKSGRKRFSTEGRAERARETAKIPRNERP